ncbi:alpha/beta hydrolase [Variovorax rhizosphaerae]|uniref:Alpha/beta hydrolase n=1 Tax=Variovorax rhizosphaerae TaxID=1836200 RepID=A0ABU8WUJ9_9BURK
MKYTLPFESAIAPSAPLLLGLEYRALAEFGVFMMSQPLQWLLPRGDSHAVIIIPGLVQSGVAVTPLRNALRRLGYDAHTWDQGRNLGFSKAELHSVREQAEELAGSTGKKVSIIGWSLGGIYARELAFEIPDVLRQVITLAAPFSGDATTSNVQWLYDTVTKSRAGEIDDAMAMRIRGQLPVPSTAIYSRTDGFVAWQSCIDEHLCDTNENIEVCSSHSGLGFNAQVLYVIADRLAQPDGRWRKMSRG